MAPARRRRREKGIALLVTTLSVFLIVPTVGLAVDASFLYAVKAKLSAATDAASLAAARSLAKGMTLAEQEGTAILRAQAFFDANFPTGYLGTANKTVNITVAETAYRTRTVFVDAAVDANAYFMTFLGFEKSTVRAAGEASRRDVNLILVLDRSGSMQNTGSCTPMKNAARQFVEQFANQRDRLGLLTFSTTTSLEFAPSMNFKPTLDTEIASISCAGWTSSAMALWRAYEQLQAINEPGTLNLILFFTDGQPTTLTAHFPIKKVYDYRKETNNGWNTTIRTRPSYCKDDENESYIQDRWGNRYYDPDIDPFWDPPDTIEGIAAASQDGGFTYNNPTWGLYSKNSGNTLYSGRNCAYEYYDLGYFRRDFAYVPQTDSYGNRTRGGTSYIPVNDYLFTTGPFVGELRNDMPIALAAAAKNAAHNAAYRARDDANLRPAIYSIGLGDPTNPTYAPDDEFLQRVSNDADSPGFVEGHQTGLYVFAPDNTQLSQAFYRVASEILRISQ